MNKNNVIQVFFEKQLVGQLTMHGHNTAFEYDEDWLNNGFPISPFSLPLEKQIFVPSKPYFGVRSTCYYWGFGNGCIEIPPQN